MKSAFLDKLIDRLDKLDAGSLQTHFLHLAGEKGLLETIFHAIQEGVIVLNEEGEISFANRAAEQLLGFSSDRIVGEPVARYLKDIDWKRITDMDGEEWSKLVSREIEISYPVHRYLNFYIVPLAAVDASDRGAVVILRDITKDRIDESRTIESERLDAITLLAAGVAHEIGNPLNSLTIHLQLLKREIDACASGDSGEMKELIDVSQREVERLDLIITQFLKALRPTSPGFEQADLLQILDDTMQFLRHEIEDRDILLEVEAPETLPPAHVDRNQIKQAFFNIIRNAMQVMPDGGLLKISVTLDDRFISVAFTDTGPGIPPDDLSSIFEPYYTTKTTGSGLGLMIVQRIIRDHGGEIEVHSEPGTGTTFTLFLPRDANRIKLLKAPQEDRGNETTQEAAG